MKDIILLLFLSICLNLATSYNSKATHIIGRYTRVDHVNGFNYKIQHVLYTDPGGTASVPQSVSITATARMAIGQLVDQFTLVKVSSQQFTHGLCNGNYSVIKNVYESVEFLDPSIFNDQGGYYLVASGCCYAHFPQNIFPGTISLESYALIPSVIDSLGNQIFNSSPIHNTPIQAIACNGSPYLQDFGAMDPDGDSVAFSLYTPFGNVLGTNSVTPISAPYPDPSLQLPSISWGPGYSEQNQIHGVGPAFSPDRLQIDPVTGIATLIADEPPGFYLYGFWTQEFRNGQLIGSIFRQYPLLIVNCVNSNTNPPVATINNSNPNLVQIGDTLFSFQGPVCVDVEIFDADSISSIELSLQTNILNSHEIDLTLDSGMILLGSSLNTQICIQPDSFTSDLHEIELFVSNPSCAGIQLDTLRFFLKFMNFSNAGPDSTITYLFGQQPYTIDLSSLIGSNRNQGGIWRDLNGTGLINNSGLFFTGLLQDTGIYHLAYIDQQNNFPEDTAIFSFHLPLYLSREEWSYGMIEIYPNPARDMIQLVLTEITNFDGLMIRFYDLQGKLKSSGAIKSKISFHDMSSLEPGLYLCEVKIVDQVIRRKVIIE